MEILKLSSSILNFMIPPLTSAYRVGYHITPTNDSLGGIWLHTCQRRVLTVVKKGVSSATCLGRWWRRWHIYCETGEA